MVIVSRSVIQGFSPIYRSNASTAYSPVHDRVFLRNRGPVYKGVTKTPFGVLIKQNWSGARLTRGSSKVFSFSLPLGFLRASNAVYSIGAPTSHSDEMKGFQQESSKDVSWGPQPDEPTLIEGKQALTKADSSLREYQESSSDAKNQVRGQEGLFDDTPSIISQLHDLF